MGTDAALFALKAKKYCYYDRDYNFVPSCNLTDAAAPLLEDIREHRPINAHQARMALVLHSSEDVGCSGHPGWRAVILRFIDAHPEDTFVRHTDSGEPTWHDVRDAGGYSEWKDSHD